MKKVNCLLKIVKKSILHKQNEWSHSVHDCKSKERF